VEGCRGGDSCVAIGIGEGARSVGRDARSVGRDARSVGRDARSVGRDVRSVGMGMDARETLSSSAEPEGDGDLVEASCGVMAGLGAGAAACGWEEASCESEGATGLSGAAEGGRLALGVRAMRRRVRSVLSSVATEREEWGEEAVRETEWGREWNGMGCGWVGRESRRSS
jgi:hypothetical protein